MLYARCSDSLAVIAVEAKVDEGFDETVGDWNRAIGDMLGGLACCSGFY